MCIYIAVEVQYQGSVTGGIAFYFSGRVLNVLLFDAVTTDYFGL